MGNETNSLPAVAALSQLAPVFLAFSFWPFWGFLGVYQVVTRVLAVLAQASSINWHINNNDSRLLRLLLGHLFGQLAARLVLNKMCDVRKHILHHLL